jgi:hypothetical protein
MKRLFVFITVYVISGIGFTQSPDFYDEEIIGITYYDLQTWRAMQNRLFTFEDGTFGAVWNHAEDFPGFPDMGVGYSYYDGNQWIGPPFPYQSITSVWAIFPSYTAYGENGELCFSQGETGLVMSSREEKGTGDWIENYLAGTNYRHPFVVASGVDHHVIQLLCLDPEPDFTGNDAQPERGELLYSRTIDGGQTWDPENFILDGTGPEDYLGFTIGAYAWAEPRGDNIAFVAGDFHTDLILMKSTDGGDSWQKTVIWEHPYPFFELGTFNSDTFYCNDGGISVALDGAGKAHVSFSLTRVFSSLSLDSAWYVGETDGVVYWNEDRDVFSNNINALNPYGHPDSELIEDYSLIGWSQDVNNNGELDILDNLGTYPTPGLSTMTQIATSESGKIIVAWSSVTETYDNGNTNFRHIWARSSSNDGNNWGNFVDLNEDLIFIFSENVYPVLSKDFDDEYFFTSFQEDNVPGLSGPEPPYEQNKIWFYPEFIGWIPTTVQADFTADTTVIHVGDTVHFINLSSGYPPNSIQYAWTFEGGVPQASNDTNPEVVYLDEGIFDVELTANISTFAIDTKTKEDYITVLPATNFSEVEKENRIRIYPNPGTGKFILDFSAFESQEIEYSIYDLLGTLVKKESILVEKGYKRTINLTHQADGIYYIMIKTGNDLYAMKLVVQH